MSANVALTDTFDQWRVKTNEVLVMTQTDGMSNFIKLLDTTNSTSNTTGSIITAGGVGIAKSAVIGENLRIHGNVITDGDTTISGNLVFGDAATDQVTFSADINSNIIPNSNLTFNVGNTLNMWANTYTGHLGVTQKSDSAKAAVTVLSEDVDQISVDLNASQTTGNVLDITAADLTTGSALAIDSDSDSTSPRNIASIIQNHASAVAAVPLYVKQDAPHIAGKFDAQTTLVIPVGTTAQRGTAVQGGIRYNSQISSFEGYSGSSWGSLGGLIDVDQDTKIIAETSAGADNDDLDFYTAGTQRMKIDQAGVVTVGVDGTGYDVQFFGDTAGKNMLWDESADTFKVTGLTQLTGTLTVGVDDTGHDVKFFGATAGHYLYWNENENRLQLTDNVMLSIGVHNDMNISHDGTNTLIAVGGGSLRLAAETSGIPIVIGHTTSETTVSDNLSITGNLTVGVDDTGGDVKFHAATAGSFMLWDESQDALEIRGGPTNAGTLKLTTAEPSVVDGNRLGRIDFQAPIDGAGTDAVAVAASIWAEADATFSATVNDTDLVFATGLSETATEKMRLTSGGKLGISTVTPTGWLTIDVVDDATRANVVTDPSGASLLISTDYTDDEYTNIYSVYSAGNNATKTKAAHWMQTDTTNGTLLGWSTTSNFANGVTRDDLIINPAGDVGIGTATLGTGNKLLVHQSTAGATTKIKIDNADNTNAASHSCLFVSTGGASGGDAMVNFNNRVTNFTMGLDNDGDVFRICNSQDNLSSNARLTMTEAGLVGIGTTSPASIFHLSGANARMTITAAATDPAYIKLEPDNAASTSQWLVTANKDSPYSLQFHRTNATTHVMTMQGTNGYVGINTTSPSSTFHVSGTITESSFREMKTNIEPMENMLPSVLQMQGVKFDFKEGYGAAEGKDNYGFIAEDTAEILPHLCSYDEEGNPVGVQYSKMTAVLLEAIKEQQVQIDELKAKLN